MSRNLPARPNLEYLKKEAKDRLDALRQSDSSAQLADAQFALAREYGFDSWPKMKAHVESIAPPAANPLAGGWIANLAKSKRHPANLFRTARVHFTIDGNGVDIVDEFVDESGKAVRGRNHVDADGVERQGRNGYSLTARWLTNGLEVITQKDGVMIGTATYALSPDARQLTVFDDRGESIIVFDRSPHAQSAQKE